MFFRMFLLSALTALSCSPEIQDTIPDISADTFVITSDFSTGGYALLNSRTLETVKDSRLGLGLVHSDATAVYSGGLIYVLNRMGRDNLQVLDPSEGYKTILEISTGRGSNPQEIAFASPGKAYISRYNESSILILEPSAGRELGKIDLSAFAHSSAKGLPRMSALHYDSATGRLFAAVQRLKSDWQPSEYSSVVVIDCATDAVIKEIILESDGIPGLNPSGSFVYLAPEDWQPPAPSGNRHLMISCQGMFGHFMEYDCGIVAVDMDALEMLPFYVITEEEAGGDICSFAVADDGWGYALTSDEEFRSALIRFDTASGQRDRVIISDSGNYGYLWDLNYDRETGLLLVCDRNAMEPGLRIFDLSAGIEQLNGGKPVPAGLPPFKTIFMKD